MVEKEQLQEILNAEGELDAKIDTIINTYQEDFDAQLNALKANKEAIKQEKTDEIAKRHTVEKERDALKEANNKLEKQLKELAPEEMQKVYDAKLQEAANLYAGQISELQKTIDEQKNKIAEGEKAQLRNECMAEFNKAIQGANIAPDSLEAFSAFVLGEDCAKFARRPIGDGKSILATKNGLSIKQAVEEARQTTFGKNCILNTSTGGGAEGGSKRYGNDNNPFVTNNKTEQALLKVRDPQLYEALKRQAGR